MTALTDIIYLGVTNINIKHRAHSIKQTKHKYIQFFHGSIAKTTNQILTHDSSNDA